MNLSEHFAVDEFERDGAAIPQYAIPAFVCLCENLLEPIRAQVRQPLIVTSGYRSPESNAAAHGVQNSQHIATAIECAADFKIETQHDLRSLFDWLRLKSGLNWDQLILEHQRDAGPDIIHISWVINGARRDAFEGSTANQSAYMRIPVNTPQQAEDSNWTT